MTPPNTVLSPPSLLSTATVFPIRRCYGVQDPVEVAGRRTPKAKFVRENPKLAIWFTAAEIIACLHVEFEVAKVRLQKLGWAEFEKLTTASK